MIDPQAQSVLDELQAGAKPMPTDQDEWLKGYRATLEAVVDMQGPSPAIARVLELDCCAQDGSRFALRLYQPTDRGPWPTLLYIHGGGFVAGSLAGYDIPLRWLALRSGWQIAAVAYRLAPEHPYPFALEDCLAALSALLENPEVDVTKIAVAGDSAGGLLATLVARRAAQTGHPLVHQILLYPNTDLREGPLYRSRTAFDGVVIRMDELYRSLDLYLGPADRTWPEVSPISASDLGQLPPALVVTNEYDPLRDEGEAYGERLREAGVPTVIRRLDGMIHTSMQRGARIAAGDALITHVAETLREIRNSS